MFLCKLEDLNCEQGHRPDADLKIIVPLRKKCRFPLNYTFPGEISSLLELDVSFKFMNTSNPFLKLKL